MRQISRPPFDTRLMSGLPSLLASSISTLLPDSSQASCSITCERTPSGSFAFATPDAPLSPQPHGRDREHAHPSEGRASRRRPSESRKPWRLSLAPNRARATTINGRSGSAARCAPASLTLPRPTIELNTIVTNDIFRTNDAFYTAPRSPLTVTYVHVVYLHGRVAESTLAAGSQVQLRRGRLGECVTRTLAIAG